MTESSREKRGCFFVIMRLFSGGPSNKGQLPYRVRDDFLSVAERSFYGVLRTALSADLVVFPKVGLKDLFYVVKPNENGSYWGRIAQRHVDFVICDAKTVRPLMAVELDDASHQRADHKERDEFLNELFRVAGLPLLRFPARSTYSVQEILGRINAVMPSAAVAERSAVRTSPNSPVASVTAGPPDCPKCGIPMALRTSTRGENRGGSFYGCVNYPKCRETRPV